MSAQHWENSATAWIEFVEHGDLNRKLLLDPPMLRLAGDVAGLEVCDVGCGEGRFSRMLSERGANVTGIEPTRALIERARSCDPRGRYIEARGEEIPIADNTFDLVVNYLVLIDIEDFAKAIREMARITKPGGRILAANLNSFATSKPSPWIKDDEGRLLHFTVDDYFTERGELVEWREISIINYHRPFEAYMKAFLACGLRLTDFEEPILTAEQVEAHPRMADSLRVSYFHVMQWRKE